VCGSTFELVTIPGIVTLIRRGRLVLKSLQLITADLVLMRGRGVRAGIKLLRMRSYVMTRKYAGCSLIAEMEGRSDVSELRYQ
jgi:hypothetical protein